MRLLFSAIVMLIVAVILAVFARDDPGYVMIHYREWVVETSLVLVFILIAGTFALLYLILRLIISSHRLPQRLQRWLHQRRIGRANAAMTQGLLEMAKGDWRKAEKELIRHVSNSQTPLLNYLTAARAAQKQGNHERRDYYLQQAHKAMPKAGLAIGLTQAELQIDQGQLEQALATLTHLRQQTPKHVTVLKLLLRLYVDLHDWERLLALLPVILKRKGIGSDKAEQLEVLAQSSLLQRAAAEKEVRFLDDTWQRVSKLTRHHAAVVIIYAQGLIDHGEGQRAEVLLAQALNRDWEETLIRMYGVLPGADSGRQIRCAEAWLKSHRHDAVLLLSLGRLCLRNKTWGQARHYLESSLALDDQPETCAELAQLMEHQGDNSLALRYYRQGIQRLSPVAVMPAPEITKGRGLVGQ